MIGSLFTGYGGLDTAAQQAFGLPLAFVSDIEPGPITVQAHHHPDTPNLGDVSTIDWTPWRGRIDVLTGGFPCQDVSTAGARAGLGGARSGLWTEMLRAITELRPRHVVIENVRGLLSAAAVSHMEPCPWCVGDGEGVPLRALGAVLGGLADAGYNARWCGLRAADVGACHGRYRVFILATDADREHLRVEPVSESRSGGPAVATPAIRDTDRSNRDRRAAAGLTRQAGPTPGSAALMPTPRATDGTNGGPVSESRDGMSQALRPHAVNTSRLEDALAVYLPTPGANLGTNGGAQHPDKRKAGNHSVSLQDVCEFLPSAAHRFGDYTAVVERHERALGRPAPDPTEPAPRGGQRLSARFVEWMMMLPAGHVTDVPGITRNQQLRLLGNGVVPAQAEEALRHMTGTGPNTATTADLTGEHAAPAGQACSESVSASGVSCG